jgi:hypothetical protein
MKDYKIIIALFISSLMFTSADIFSQVKVSLPDLELTPEKLGEIIEVPVKVSSLTEYSVKAFELAVSYDTSIIKIIGFNKTNTISESVLLAANADTLKGIINLAGAIGSDLKGAGDLVKLRIKIMNYGVTNLSLENESLPFKFNNGKPSAIIKNGMLEIVKPKEKSKK